MALFTEAIEAKLIENGNKQLPLKGTDDEQDFVPVVKLFTPDGGATWLLTEIDPVHPDTAFGLCDLGMGFPELGYVSLAELRALRGKLGLPVERDMHFTGTKPLSEYARGAATAGRIKT